MTGNVVPGDQGSKKQPGRLLGELGQDRGILGSLLDSPWIYLLSVTFQEPVGLSSSVYSLAV